MIRRYGSITLFSLLFPVVCCAEAIVFAPEHEWDFGTIAAGAPVVHSFIMKNAGTTDLLISKMYST
ncbi:MAG: DUF1573 domain-containing protein [Nitrospiraceae bacterium]|jgi:hypothetical protein|nr:DUF1573 domain-containing protein [Nitrospiraceae bacterium]